LLFSLVLLLPALLLPGMALFRFKIPVVCSQLASFSHHLHINPDSQVLQPRAVASCALIIGHHGLVAGQARVVRLRRLRAYNKINSLRPVTARMVTARGRAGAQTTSTWWS